MSENSVTWRKHETHREETKAVKAALQRAGISFTKVGHGTGTAWGWLHIDLAEPWKPGPQTLDEEALRVAQQATGRHGQYDGCILVQYAISGREF